jgi:hypothetical protein
MDLFLTVVHISTMVHSLTMVHISYYGSLLFYLRKNPNHGSVSYYGSLFYYGSLLFYLRKILTMDQFLTMVHISTMVHSLTMDQFCFTEGKSKPWISFLLWSTLLPWMTLLEPTRIQPDPKSFMYRFTTCLLSDTAKPRT